MTQYIDKDALVAEIEKLVLAREEPYPDTYYRMCQDIIECLTKIKKIV